MLRTRLLLGLMGQVRPRASLMARLARHGPQGPGVHLHAGFSGRTLLAELARLPRFTRRVVLLPEYLCNVVPMAFERSGWRVATYPVDQNFEPDATDLQARVQREQADVLLLAPLYGADGGVVWALSAPGRALRARHGLTLVLDLCQDAGRLADVAGAPTGLDRDWAVLTSFNDKSFPGAMGAALWTDGPDWPAPHGPNWWQSAALNAWLLRRLLLPRAPQAAGGDRYEHSQARRFPYGFDVTGASRLQLALGADGLELLPRWQARRRAAASSSRLVPLALPHAAVAPFVVAAPGGCQLQRRKRPYACFDDPARSLRPGLVVVHNKGFDDR